MHFGLMVVISFDIRKLYQARGIHKLQFVVKSAVVGYLEGFFFHFSLHTQNPGLSAIRTQLAIAGHFLPPGTLIL